MQDKGENYRMINFKHIIADEISKITNIEQKEIEIKSIEIKKTSSGRYIIDIFTDTCGNPDGTECDIKKICKLLEMTDDEYASKIGDFYTALTTDKTFILLDDASWDLRDRHSVKITLNDDETEDEEDLSETEEELDDELDDMASEDMHDMDDDSDLDDPDLDDVHDVEDVDDDLTIIDEEELD